MRLNWRDGVATAMTAAVAVLYWAFLADVDIAFFASARAVGGAALVLG